MAGPDYTDSVQDVLDAIGTPDGSLGSGSAVALSLSVAIRCLELQLSLTEGRDEHRAHAAYHAGLRERIEGWRTLARDAFVEDPAHFGEVLAARRRREGADADEIRTVVETELDALRRASGVLLSLAALARDLESDADLMLRERGAAHARAEAATASALARAAGQALAAMLAANVRTATARRERYGTAPWDDAAIRGALPGLPPGPGTEWLERELARTDKPRTLRPEEDA